MIQIVIKNGLKCEQMRLVWLALRHVNTLYKIRQNLYTGIIGWDDARPSYCVFSIFKKAAIRHLGFSYFFLQFL